MGSIVVYYCIGVGRGTANGGSYITNDHQYNKSINEPVNVIIK